MSEAAEVSSTLEPGTVPSSEANTLDSLFSSESFKNNLVIACIVLLVLYVAYSVWTNWSSDDSSDEDTEEPSDGGFNLREAIASLERKQRNILKKLSNNSSV